MIIQVDTTIIFDKISRIFRFPNMCLGCLQGSHIAGTAGGHVKQNASC